MLPSMDSRYSHPEVSRLWSLPGTYRLWLDIETETLRAQRNLDHGVRRDETAELLDFMGELLVRPEDVEQIRKNEAVVKHDVVAFLEWLRISAKESHWVPEGAERWVHYGLTSSDVVDSAQGLRFNEMRSLFLRAAGETTSQLIRWAADDSPVIGRTHGQVAELMTMRARASHWLLPFNQAVSDLSRQLSRMSTVKLSGPVGTYAHNPPGIEQEVARVFKCRAHGMGASQVVSRAPLAAWANTAAVLVEACANIGTDIRLMKLVGEARPHIDRLQVGSSSMAHKQNPIREEKLAGMARMAHGYASMLQGMGGWLERDLSSSSVERVAVPDLWHVVMHTLKTTTAVLMDLQLDQWAIDGQIRASIDPLVAERTLHYIQLGKDVHTARADASRAGDRKAQPEDAIRMMRYYP